MLRVCFIVGFSLAPYLPKNAQVSAKLWLIYGFVSKFSLTFLLLCLEPPTPR
jgi:hypothetical protein